MNVKLHILKEIKDIEKSSSSFVFFEISIDSDVT